MKTLPSRYKTWIDFLKHLKSEGLTNEIEVVHIEWINDNTSGNFEGRKRISTKYTVDEIKANALDDLLKEIKVCDHDKDHYWCSYRLSVLQNMIDGL